MNAVTARGLIPVNGKLLGTRHSQHHMPTHNTNDLIILQLMHDTLILNTTCVLTPEIFKTLEELLVDENK